MITTIEITDEMVRETIKRAVQKWNESDGPNRPILTPSDIFSEDVRDYLTAALPIIKKQVREQCAAEIEAAMIEEAPGKVHNDSAIYMRNIGFQRGLKHATRIVREVQ